MVSKDESNLALAVQSYIVNARGKSQKDAKPSNATLEEVVAWHNSQGGVDNRDNR